MAYLDKFHILAGETIMECQRIEHDVKLIYAGMKNGNFDENYHFHIEFFPPMRSADKQKFNASSETGVWAHCNPTCPEATSEELRAAFAKFKSK